MAARRMQLRKMVEEARKRPWYHVGPVAKVLGGVAAAAVAASLLIPNTLGHSRELTYEIVARSELRAIAVAEAVYQSEHGTYGALKDLLDAEMIALRKSLPYDFEIVIDDDTFTATARHRTRPDTRRAFRVGPDGEVETIE